MDDDMAPRPGLWLRANAVIHLIVVALLTAGLLVWSIPEIWEAWQRGIIALGFVIVMALLVFGPTGSLLLCLHQFVFRENVGAAALIGLLFCLSGFICSMLLVYHVVDIMESRVRDPHTPFVILALSAGYSFAIAIPAWRWITLMDRWRAQSTPRCPTCEYNLRGLDPDDSPTCPECGADIVELLRNEIRREAAAPNHPPPTS